MRTLVLVGGRNECRECEGSGSMYSLYHWPKACGFCEGTGKVLEVVQLETEPELKEEAAC